MLCRHDKYLQVIAHMYRGEMNRLTIYRQRLDIISTWSITLLTGLVALFVSQNVHTVFICGSSVLIFSFIEARRYRYYRLAHHRVRLIEVGFYVGEVLSADAGSESLQQLIESLTHPTFPLSFFRSWIIRVYRNYIWMMYLILIAYILKTDVSLIWCLFPMISILALHAALAWTLHSDPIDT